MFYHKQNDDTFANLPVQKSLLRSYQKYFLQTPGEIPTPASTSEEPTCKRALLSQIYPNFSITSKLYSIFILRLKKKKNSVGTSFAVVKEITQRTQA